MPILSIGLNHRTAPIEVRETIAFEGETLPDALTALVHLPAIQEAVILSTCNRTEIYAAAPDLAQAEEAVIDLLCARSGEAAHHFVTRLYRHRDEAATHHLMQVACGLDSMILGEPQVLGQVNVALQAAQAAQTVGPILSQLFTSALRAGKRARTETAISRHTTSTSHAAILLARRQLPNLAEARALVVGAGDMATLAIKALSHQQVRQIGCINRTPTRADALIQRVQGRSFRWHEFQEALIWADLVIAATGAPHTVIHREDVAEILPERAGRPLTLIDIALPRNIDQAVAELPQVFLHDIDDLHATLDDNLVQREAARPKVNAIITQERERFQGWQRSRQAIPVLVNMRRKVEELAQAELADALAQMPNLTEQESAALERMVHRLVNKVLHEPTIHLKQMAAEAGQPSQCYTQMVQHLFALSPGANGQSGGSMNGCGNGHSAPMHGPQQAIELACPFQLSPTREH
jgi:glutamyl-tRNA reductase